jgi:hypothetical protein
VLALLLGAAVLFRRKHQVQPAQDQHREKVSESR